MGVGVVVIAVVVVSWCLSWLDTARSVFGLALLQFWSPAGLLGARSSEQRSMSSWGGYSSRSFCRGGREVDEKVDSIKKRH